MTHMREIHHLFSPWPAAVNSSKSPLPSSSALMSTRCSSTASSFSVICAPLARLSLSYEDSAVVNAQQVHLRRAPKFKLMFRDMDRRDKERNEFNNITVGVRGLSDPPSNK